MARNSMRKFYLMLGLGAMCFVSAVANAQVTITSVKVTETSISGAKAVYCDTSTACPGGLQLWTLGGGITLNAAETLVLTQTGAVAGTTTFGNFDTSDQVTAAQTLHLCTPSDPCITTVEINGSLVYTSGPGVGGDVLNFFNKDDAAQPTISEAHDWVLAATEPTYTLSLGYADNEHNTTCPAAAPSCFPIPFASGSTHFLGAGINTLIESCSSNCYDGGALMITGIGSPQTFPGRMTGGGSVFTTDGTRVTHGFELHCNVNDSPNTLEINWPPANNFHMNVLTSAICIDTLAVQAPPNAPFDTFIGTGTGKLNGVAGASIAFTLVDAGEPGTSDTAAYVITDIHGTVLNVGPAFLDKGNQQAHK